MNDEQLIELAENANTYTPLGPTDVRIANDRYVLWMGRGDEPGWNVAQRFRLRADEVEEVRAELHEILRKRGRTGLTWEVGTHATPGDLIERLLALGLVDDEPTPLAVGMVLTERARPRRRPTSRCAARRRPEERLAAATDRRDRVRRAGARPSRRRRATTRTTSSIWRSSTAVPVARASASFGEHAVSLFGGSTLPEARGRGAYRALVAARWEDAVARGTPVLVTQASPMSRPILARLGFREVCEIRILLDKFA